jgi:hypothetical protein
MSTRTEAEDRVLDIAELEIVYASRPPTLEQQSVQQLKALVHRLRKAHGRAKDISARQRREIRGKSDPRGATRVHDNTGSIAKVQVLFEAIHRVDAELSRRERMNTGTASQAELSRHALEQKLQAHSREHPDPGRSASDGMRPKKRSKPVKIGTTRREIGRVSKAGKIAQARKDGRKG